MAVRWSKSSSRTAFMTYSAISSMPAAIPDARGGPQPRQPGANPPGGAGSIHEELAEV